MESESTIETDVVWGVAVSLKYIQMTKGLLFAFRYCISPPICLLGFFGNTVIIVTFIRMGLTDSVAIGFFNLAISDMCVLFVQLLDFLERTKIIQGFDDLFDNLEHIGYSLTALLTTFMSIQRCLCVLLPFRFKSMFTRSKTLIILSVVWVYSLTLGAYSSVQTWIDEVVNMTRLDKILLDARLESISADLRFVNSVIFRPLCTVLVLLCLSIMVYVLKKSVQFRLSTTRVEEKSTGDSGKSAKRKDDFRIDSKERQAIIQVAIVSGLFLLASLREIEKHIRRFVFKRMSPGPTVDAVYVFFRVIGSLLEAVVHLNSSVNVLIYYNFNTKFRKMCFMRPTRPKL